MVGESTAQTLYKKVGTFKIGTRFEGGAQSFFFFVCIGHRVISKALISRYR